MAIGFCACAGSGVTPPDARPEVAPDAAPDAFADPHLDPTFGTDGVLSFPASAMAGDFARADDGRQYLEYFNDGEFRLCHLPRGCVTVEDYGAIGAVDDGVLLGTPSGIRHYDRDLGLLHTIRLPHGSWWVVRLLDGGDDTIVVASDLTAGTLLLERISATDAVSETTTLPVEVATFVRDAAIAGDRIYVSTDTQVLAIDASTFAIDPSFTLADHGQLAPLPDGGVIVAEAHVTAYAPDGSVRWSSDSSLIGFGEVTHAGRGTYATYVQCAPHGSGCTFGIAHWDDTGTADSFQLQIEPGSDVQPRALVVEPDGALLLAGITTEGDFAIDDAFVARVLP